MRGEWGELPNERRRELQHFLLRNLNAQARQPGCPHYLLAKLSEAVAFIAVHTKHGSRQLLRELKGVFAGAPGAVLEVMRSLPGALASSTLQYDGPPKPNASDESKSCPKLRHA